MGMARPVIVLAAKFLGPGPTRLRLVKLAHELDGGVVAPSKNGHAGDVLGHADLPERAA